jgi:PAS domain S-box-containing protein
MNVDSLGKRMTSVAFRNLLLRLVLPPFFAIALLGLLAYLVTLNLENHAALINRADRAVAEASQLLGFMADEESGVRGYLATDDPLFLQPFNQAGTNADAVIARLEQDSRQEPEQAERLRAIIMNFRSFQDLNQQIVRSRPSGEARLNLLKRQKIMMDALQRQLADFNTAELAIRSRGRSLLDESHQRLSYLNEEGRALVLALLCWSSWRAFRRVSDVYSGQLQDVRLERDRLDTTLRSIGDAVIVTDRDTVVTTMNQVAEHLTGWAMEDARGRSLSEVFHIVNESTRLPAESPAEKVKRLGSVVGPANHTILVRRDGTETPIDDSAAPIREADAIAGIVLVFRDITQRRQSEKALQLSAERLRLALTAGNGIGTWDWDIPADRIYSDAHFAHMFGIDPLQAQEGVGVGGFLHNIHPDDQERVRQAINRALKRGEEFSAEYRVVQNHGSARWVFALGRCHFAPDGTPARFPGVIIDVTERRRIQDSLRESEARLSAIYSTSQEYIGLLTPDGTILDCNRASLDFAGNTREQIIGLKLWEWPWFSNTPAALARLRESVTRAARGEFIRYEIPLTRPDGETITFDFSLSPVQNSKGEVIFLVPEGRDITGLKRAELALLQSEKLAVVGRLAASIAHEINNPLEAVTNLLYLARGNPDTTQVQEFLSLAERELRRVSVISNQTLRFYRQSTGPKKIPCQDLLEGVLSMHQGRLINSHVRVEQRLKANRPLLCFDGEVRQVLNNLIGNAIDALHPGGGRLCIRTREGTNWRTGRHGAVITIADTGLGMSPKVLKKIFEPFFTTKGIGGTGLGLWVSKEIVSRHEGDLRVRSSQKEGSRGTVFALFLPFEVDSGKAAELAADREHQRF